MVDLLRLVGWVLLVLAVVALVATTIDWLSDVSSESYTMFQQGYQHRHTTYGLRAPMASPGDAVNVFLKASFGAEWDLIVLALGGAIVAPWGAWLAWRILKQVLT